VELAARAATSGSLETAHLEPVEPVQSPHREPSGAFANISSSDLAKVTSRPYTHTRVPRSSPRPSARAEALPHRRAYDDPPDGSRRCRRRRPTGCDRAPPARRTRPRRGWPGRHSPPRRAAAPVHSPRSTYWRLPITRRARAPARSFDQVGRRRGDLRLPGTRPSIRARSRAESGYDPRRRSRLPQRVGYRGAVRDVDSPAGEGPLQPERPLFQATRRPARRVANALSSRANRGPARLDRRPVRPITA
jgi:hypothetical protein